MKSLARLRLYPSLLPAASRSILQNGELRRRNSIRTNFRSLSSLETLLEYERDKPPDDRKAGEKNAALHVALSQLAGDFDHDSQLSLHRFTSTRSAPVISTGSLKLDRALGVGGLPKGRMVEIFGKEASGKTTLALHIVKEAQKLGGCCAYINVENALDDFFAEAIGVDTQNLLVAHPNSAENSLSIVNTLVSSGSVDVIVVDSVAALVPECCIGNIIDMHYHDVLPRLMTQALRKIHYSLSRSQVLIVFVNQVRFNPRLNQVIGRTTEVTCGGNALQFYASVRMKLIRNGLHHNGNEVTGINISVEIIKNKLAPAMKKATLDIGFGTGINSAAEILDLACTYGAALKEGSRYWIKDNLFNDQSEAQQYLIENSAVADELVRTIRSQFYSM